MISSSYLGFPDPMFSKSRDNDPQDDAQFEVDEYLSFNGEEEGHILPVPPENKQKHFTLQENTHQKACSEQEKRGFINGASIGCRMKIAFKTKSDIEILDDGYKWRKYGKKKVKNSPHPRNYYQCANTVCSVKKRVERQCEDSRYVITTYEGVHNHHPSQMQKQINTDLARLDSKTTLQMEQHRRHY